MGDHIRFLAPPQSAGAEEHRALCPWLFHRAVRFLDPSKPSLFDETAAAIGVSDEGQVRPYSRISSQRVEKIHKIRTLLGAQCPEGLRGGLALPVMQRDRGGDVGGAAIVEKL